MKSQWLLVALAIFMVGLFGYAGILNTYIDLIISIISMILFLFIAGFFLSIILYNNKFK